MITKEEIQKLAELARIQLTDSEISSLQSDVSNILEYVGQISGPGSVGDEKIAPQHHNVMRDDIPHSEGSALGGKREALLKALPRRSGDYAVVRKIIQKDE